MAEPGEGLEEDGSEQKSHHGWRKLRARLRSNEDKSSKPSRNDSEPQDLAGFLRSGSSAQPQPGRLRAQPKIDIAAVQRLSGASQGGDGEDGPGLEEKWRPTKPRRREGLRVGFVDTAPEIIGEGGDEAETPASLVSPPTPNRHPPVLPEHAPVMPLDLSAGPSQKGVEFSPIEQVSSVSSMSSSEYPSPLQANSSMYGVTSTDAQTSFAERSRNHAVQSENEPMQDFRRKPLKRVPTGFSEVESYVDEIPPPEAPQRNAMQPSTPTVRPSSPEDPELARIPDFRSEDRSYDPLYNGRRLPRPDPAPYKSLQQMREDEAQAFLTGSRKMSVSPASQEDGSRPQSSGSLAQLAPSPSQIDSLPQAGHQNIGQYHRHQKSMSPPANAFRFQNSTTTDDYFRNDSKPSSSQSSTPPIYAPQPTLQALSNQVRKVPLHVQQTSAERVPSISPQYRDRPQYGNTLSGQRPSVSPQANNVKATTRKPSPQRIEVEREPGPPPPYEQLPHTNPEPQVNEKTRPPTRSLNSHLDPLGPSPEHIADQELRQPQSHSQPFLREEYNQPPLPQTFPRREHDPPGEHDLAQPHPPPTARQEQYSVQPKPPTAPRREYNPSREQLPPATQGLHNSSRPHGQSISAPTPGEDALSKDHAFAEFVERTSHMYNIFRLGSESQGSSLGYSLVDWLRAALWWFLRGRDGIEKAFRGRPRGNTGGREVSPNVDARQFIQPHVDLAKSWWIITDVVDNAIDSEVSEVKEIKTELLDSMKRLCLSMAKRNALPPPHMLVQATDNSIWVTYPDLAPEVLSSLSETYAIPGSGPPPVLLTLPLGDSQKMYNYGRFFVQVVLLRADEDFNEHPIQDAFPCVLSLLRGAGDSQVSCVIASQNRLVYTTVRPKNTVGPSWDHVRWEQESQSMRIKLPRKLRMRLHFSKTDFDTFWGAFDYIQRVNMTSKARDDEILLQNITVPRLQYHDTMYPQSFPVEPAMNCLVSVFERYRPSDEDSERKLHRFYRLAVATSPYDKLLRSVFVEVGKHVPVEYTYNQQGRQQDMPTMQIFVNETSRSQFISMTFNEFEHRDLVRDYLTGRIVSPDETEVTHSPNVSLSFTPEPTSSTASISTSMPIKFEWNGLQVINKVKTDSHGYEHLPTTNSEHLRILLTGRNGSVVDRLNITPGNLSLRLPTDSSLPSISLVRPAREDATFSMGPHPAIPEHLHTLQKAQSITATARHILTYAFPTPAALHDFQAALTGYQVLYDGTAANFAISRRRMVVPIYRKFDTDRARIQIVRHPAEGPGAQPLVQLLAFFDDYSLADALNFQLKSTDLYELSEAAGANKAALWGVKLVDAKFALPDREKDREKVKEKDREREREKEAEGEESAAAAGGARIPTRRRSRFVTLDSLEYPSEHEDITIGFDTEAERDRFADALPAAPQVGKKFTLKRRI